MNRVLAGKCGGLTEINSNKQRETPLQRKTREIGHCQKGKMTRPKPTPVSLRRKDGKQTIQIPKKFNAGDVENLATKRFNCRSGGEKSGNLSPQRRTFCIKEAEESQASQDRPKPAEVGEAKVAHCYAIKQDNLLLKNAGEDIWIEGKRFLGL